MDISPHPAAPATLSPGLSLLLATACGLIVANIYYAQPLIAPISADLGLSPAAAGLIVTMTQAGYGIGLLLVVPLADLVENRRLTLGILVLGIVALLASAAARSPAPFLAAALFTGLGSVAVQVLIPYAAHMAPPAASGRVVGNILGGVMLGIMLARPVASFITEASSWHVVFLVSAAVMAALTGVLAFAMPPRHPASGGGRYWALLLSMAGLVRDNPVLRRRAFYQACMFGAFSLFWTAVPLHLATHFGLSQNGIALFALAGVAGAVSAPIAGRLADRGWTGWATAVGMALAAAAFLLARAGLAPGTTALALLVAAAIMLDFGVSGSFVLGQRTIFGLDPAARGRLNGLYLAALFVGGAVCSGLAGWSYAHGGWGLTCSVGTALPLAALLVYATERRA